MRRDTAHRPEGELRAWLDHHCFAQEQWTQACDTLSGGEKLKLLLFGETLGASAPDLLLLDEPTNNVDLRSQELLLGALSEYKGTVVAVSPTNRSFGIWVLRPNWRSFRDYRPLRRDEVRTFGPLPRDSSVRRAAAPGSSSSKSNWRFCRSARFTRMRTGLPSVMRMPVERPMIS